MILLKMLFRKGRFWASATTSHIPLFKSTPISPFFLCSPLEKPQPMSKEFGFKNSRPLTLSYFQCFFTLHLTFAVYKHINSFELNLFMLPIIGFPGVVGKFAEGEVRPDHRGGVQVGFQGPRPEPHPLGLQDGQQIQSKNTKCDQLTRLKYRKS